MKLLIIPDIHGIFTWRLQVNNALFESDTHIVFLGDYVDSFSIKGWEILQNLKNIIELKRKYPDKITLLLGNHDYAYIFGKYGISGFDFHMFFDYKQLFNDNYDIFNVAWGFQGKDKYTLVTHAGLTQTFYDNIVKEILDPESIMNDILVKEADEPWDKMPLHKLLNYFIDQCHLLWQIGPYRKGFNETGSILWADKRELLNDRFKGIDQIIGHTVNSYVEIKSIEDDKIYFTDVHTEYHLIGFMIELN